MAAQHDSDIAADIQEGGDPPRDNIYLDVIEALRTLAERQPKKMRAAEMTVTELMAESARVEKLWTDMRNSDEELGGGSPGEWMVERMDEIDTLLRRNGLCEIKAALRTLAERQPVWDGEVTQEDLAAALSFLGWADYDEFCEWAVENREMDRFDELCQAFAHHRREVLCTITELEIAIRSHVEKYDTPKEDDPRRRYTVAQLETAIRLAEQRGADRAFEEIRAIIQPWVDDQVDGPTEILIAVHDTIRQRIGGQP